MCMTKTELNKVVEELRSLKTLKNETEQQIRELESGIIEFLNETVECETVDKNGKPIKQYIGTDYKTTYSTQTRENVKKDEIKKYLTDEEYEKCITRSTFGVLRVQYSMKDWGDMDAEDKQTNEEALNYPDDLYVMGAYNTSKGRIWIITNRISEIAGDNATTVCFPEER